MVMGHKCGVTDSNQLLKLGSEPKDCTLVTPSGFLSFKENPPVSGGHQSLVGHASMTTTNCYAAADLEMKRSLSQRASRKLACSTASQRFSHRMALIALVSNNVESGRFCP